jgi:hypothetical protein
VQGVIYLAKQRDHATITQYAQINALRDVELHQFACLIQKRYVGLFYRLDITNGA